MLYISYGIVSIDTIIRKDKMTKTYICDKCKKPLETDEDFGGKAMVYAGRQWRGKASHYKHFHYCKKCFKETFGELK